MSAGSVGILKMARGSRGQHRTVSRQYRSTPYLLPICKRNMNEDVFPKKCSKALDKKEWEDVTCSVCMEYPHKSVLLLCSSHDKGCRPYMCGTSFRHSNCLDQYKKAYTKVISSHNHQGVIQDLGEKEVSKLACPLCRGQVKGWTVVEPARDYLNGKKRCCMQDDCAFTGNYKELRKHVRAEHPLGRPRAVDPAHEQKWRWLELEREREDVISTVTSTMPGAMVFGDYVIEGRHNDSDTDEEDAAGAADADAAERNGRFQMGMEAMNFFLLLHTVRERNNDLDNFSRGLRPVSGRIGQLDLANEDNDNDRFSEGNSNSDVSLARHLHHHGDGRVLFDRSSRRGWHREAHTTQR